MICRLRPLFLKSLSEVQHVFEVDHLLEVLTDLFVYTIEVECSFFTVVYTVYIVVLSFYNEVKYSSFMVIHYLFTNNEVEYSILWSFIIYVTVLFIYYREV